MAVALERERDAESGVRLRTVVAPFVAVTPTKFETAWPNGPKKGSGERGPTESNYERLELEEALLRVYETDAHLVTYVVDTIATHQPRLLKESLASYPLPVFTHVLCCDVDNPGHAETTDAMLGSVALETEGIYWTKRGYRLVQPLAEPVATSEAERVLFAWLTRLEARGIAVDWACRDWTRHFRLPNVRRDGKPYRSPQIDLARMRPIAIAPAEIPTAPPRPRRSRELNLAASSPAFTSELPPAWASTAAAIAASISVSAGDRHKFSLALAGAALQMGTPEELVPAIVRAVAALTGAAQPSHHEKNARATVERRRMGIVVAGLPALWGRWPGAAAALERASAPPARRDAGAEDLEAAIARAPDGLTLVVASCGMGKTRAAERVAAERARTPYKTKDAAGLRAPPGSKTAIAVDKTELAVQVTENIRALGVSVARLFGPLSVEGDRACRYRENALPLVNGGQSLAKEFCEGRRKSKCEFYDGCTARLGYEGPASARVTVGPHSLLAQLDAEAGPTGLLVVDEPPPLLATEVLRDADLVLARRWIDDFERTYALPMTIVLNVLSAWVEHGEVPDFAELRALVPSDPQPPVKWAAMARARKHLGSARNIGATSKTLRILQRALRARGASLRLEDGRLFATVPDDVLVGALKREGAVVVTDANADLNAPLYAQIVGYEPPVRRFVAEDGAPIERTLFRMRATRTAWLRAEEPPEAFYGAVRRVLAWGAGDELGIITFKALEEDPGFKELLAGYPRPVQTAHYGGTRGLDRMKGVDALATLGDPRPNLFAAEREASFAGIEWEPRVEALARAELEQAHGRIRAVHRTRRGRACHVGQIWPGGVGWTPERVHVVDVDGRPPAAPSAVDVPTLLEELGSVRAVAERLGVTERSVRRYLDGARHCQNAGPKPL